MIADSGIPNFNTQVLSAGQVVSYVIDFPQKMQLLEVPTRIQRLAESYRAAVDPKHPMHTRDAKEGDVLCDKYPWVRAVTDEMNLGSTPAELRAPLLAAAQPGMLKLKERKPPTEATGPIPHLEHWRGVWNPLLELLWKPAMKELGTREDVRLAPKWLFDDYMGVMRVFSFAIPTTEVSRLSLQ
jgi:hypothetical protein